MLRKLGHFLGMLVMQVRSSLGGVNLIHSGVFKVASRMAQGETFSLVVPVLASIYNDLNEITCSFKPGTNASIFPIHYLYGWLGEYFDTHFISPSWNHPDR